MTNTCKNGLSITVKNQYNPLAIAAFNYRRMSYNRHFLNEQKNEGWEKSPIWGTILLDAIEQS